jgi:hypothetical protein
LPRYTIELDTADATQNDLAPAVAVVHAAGGTDVSVLQIDRRPRVEFSVEAADHRQAASIACRVRVGLTEATPLLAGGWALVSIIAA